MSGKIMSDVGVDSSIIMARKAVYGNSFPIIAGLWNNYLNNCVQGNEISPEDTAIMLALLKVARLSIAPTDTDSMQDMINYLWIAFNYNKYVEDKYE